MTYGMGNPTREDPLRTNGDRLATAMLLVKDAQR
jgi:hypothetical protein